MTVRAKLTALGLSGVLAVLLASTAGPAHASVGVAVKWGFLQIPRKLEAGRQHRLPVWGVRNPGTEATTYLLQASPVRGQQLRTAPARWFRFSPTRVKLRPGAERAVRITLKLPKRARPGRYIAIVKAGIAPTGGNGATVGAAAGARVIFTVRAPRPTPRKGRIRR